MDNDEIFISSLDDDELDDLLEALEEIYEEESKNDKRK